MTNSNIMEINNVSYRYENILAVDTLSFYIQHGEIFGLVGPDGAGKTTLIRMLCGIFDPCNGTISLSNLDTVKNKREINNKIGYLSQRFSLYGDLSIEENINFFAEIHRVKNFKKRKTELLEFTRLTPFKKRLADKLSGGMKQKLALACTLIHSPDIIFLDEPTTGVDPVSRRDFWKILNDLLTSGLTIVMSTPYLDEAERCNRIALMNHGRIVKLAAPNEIRKSLDSTFIEMVVTPLREAFQLSRNLPGVTSVQMFGDRIHIGFDKGATSKENIKSFLEKKGINIVLSRELLPSLEDVFISLITEGQPAKSAEMEQ